VWHQLTKDQSRGDVWRGMQALDLFSGIGGMSLGLREWVTTVAYCESDEFCRGVLFKRMEDGMLPPGPICEDARAIDGRELRGHIDIIIAGFPYQGGSAAGNGDCMAGEHDSLFVEVPRLVEEIEPAYVFVEGNASLRSHGLETLVASLSERGYDCRWQNIRASDAGAPHSRQRCYILAHALGERKARHKTGARTRWPAFDVRTQQAGWDEWPRGETGLCGADDGVPGELYRAARLRALGSAVVPQQAALAFAMALGIAVPFDNGHN